MYLRFHVVRLFWNQILICKENSTNISKNNPFHIFSITCVSVSLSCFESCILFDTERYLFFSNSASSALICAAVNAVRGRFLRSSAVVRHRGAGRCKRFHRPASYTFRCTCALFR